MEKKFLPKLRTYDFKLSARWCVEYTNTDNKRIRAYVPTAKTVKERIVLANEILKKVEKELKGLTTLGLKAKIYKELENRKPTYRRKTYQCKKSKLDIFTNWMYGKEWDTATVHNFFVDYLTKEKKLCNTTYNDYIVHVKEALGWCGMADLMERVVKRRAQPTPAGYFTESQRAHLVDSMRKRNPDLLFFVQFIYYCFIRPGTELRLLKVGDLILEERKICIPSSISKNKKQQYVAIPDAFLEVVREKIKGRNPSEYLFKGAKRGAPMGMNSCCRLHQKLLKDLGYDIKRYKLYSWKHTGAVAAVRAGVSLKHLQIQLRHHSLDQVDAYLRQLGVNDLGDLEKYFPSIS